MNHPALNRIKERGYVVLQNIMGQYILYYKGNVIHTEKNLGDFLDFVEKYEKGMDENESLPVEDED